MSTNYNTWRTCCGRVQKEQVVFFSQVIISYIVIITCLANITFSSQNTNLWATLASGTIGYLLPSPSLRNEPVLRNTSV
jgi:TctA family transporter